MGASGWLGIGVVVGVLGVGLVAPWLGVVLAVSAVALVLGWGGARGRAVGAWLCGVGLGLACAGWRAPGPVERGPVRVQGVVVGAPLGSTVDVWATALSRLPDGPVRQGRVRLELTGRAPPPGTEVIAFGRALDVHADLLPGGPHGVLGARLTQVRTRVRARDWHAVGGPPERRAPPGRHGGLLHALAWGDRTLLHPDLVAVLRRTGTAHLLAVSGLHVSLVAGAVGGGLRVLLRALAVFWPRGVGTRGVWLVGALAGLLYALGAGAPVGGVRAGVAAVVLAGLHAVGVRPRPRDLLAVVAGALALADPGVVATPGFQLSFGAVLGLLQLLPGLLALRPRRWPSWAAPVWLSVSASIAATVGTLPAAGWWFQGVSATSPLGNLVAGPVVSFVLVPLAGLFALDLPGLDPAIGGLADLVVDALLAVLSLLDAPLVPLALGPVSALALAVALVVHRRGVWLLAVLLAVAPGHPPPRALRLTVASVGRGQAVLVEWPDGRRWLVDGGSRREAVLHWLRRRGVHRLDVVAASVPREDHVGGLPAVVDALPVGEVWLPAGSRGDRAFTELVAAAGAAGVPVVPGPPADLAGPARAALADDADRSLVLVLRAAGGTVLLPGDLRAEGAAAVAARLEEVDVMLLPGHGSRAAGTRELLPLQPAVVVVSAPRDGPHGHPHEEVVDAVAARHGRLWRTDRDGTVELTLDARGVALRTWRFDRGWRSEGRIFVDTSPWARAGLAAEVDTRPSLCGSLPGSWRTGCRGPSP